MRLCEDSEIDTEPENSEYMKKSKSRLGYRRDEVVDRERLALVRTSPPVEEGPTTAENLDERFERGENVLDYFDLARGKMHFPK